MEYKGYEIHEGEGVIRVENVKDFDPFHTFECGQCFRWIRQPDGSYTGVAMDRVINVRYSDGKLTICNTNLDDFRKIWFDYFDLGRDYSAIKSTLAKDWIMKKAIGFGYGIRILKQDLWETLISFIISANNRIPMIMKIIGAISEKYGDRLEYGGKSYFTFPDPKRLAGLSLEELKACRGGFRCKYIINAARLVAEGSLDLQRIKDLGTESARNELKKLSGVGNKVADCTLLYSGTQYGIFPTDVWVKRVMEELYFKRDASLEEIQEFAADYFGELSGFAQQYLFFYARENKIGAQRGLK